MVFESDISGYQIRKTGASEEESAGLTSASTQSVALWVVLALMLLG